MSDPRVYASSNGRARNFTPEPVAMLALADQSACGTALDAADGAWSAPLLEAGILLTSIAAVIPNFFFNCGKADEAGAIDAANAAEAH